MAYRVLIDEPIQVGVRRIGAEQIDAALADLAPGHEDRDRAVHDARRRVKRVRALIRLARPGTTQRMAEQDALLRGAARRLSAARDAAVTIQTYDSVMERFADDVERRQYGPIRRALTLRYQDVLATGDDEAMIAAFRRDLQATLDGVARWSLEKPGFDALDDGLRGTYRDGRRAMRTAYRKSRGKGFHTWRRHVRYHALHMALLREVWPPVVRARWREVYRLGEILGSEHDMAVLSRLMKHESDRFGSGEALALFRALLKRRRRELQARARPLGRRVYAERAGALVGRFRRYWNARADELAPGPA